MATSSCWPSVTVTLRASLSPLISLACSSMTVPSSTSKPAIQTSSSDKLAKELAEAVLRDYHHEGGLVSQDTLKLAQKVALAK